MKLEQHTAFSAVISGGLYSITRSWELAAACLVSGIFIDLDHFIDYFREYGWPFKIKKFFWVFNKGELQKTLLLLHGWEWVLLLFFAAWWTGWNPWITGVLVGFGHHLLLDNICNGAHLWSYFLFWRWKNDFDHNAAFPEYVPEQKTKTNDLPGLLDKE